MKVSEIFQLETPQTGESLANVLAVVAGAGLTLEHVTALRRDQHRTLWEVTAEMDESAREQLLSRLSGVADVRFVGWSDRLFERHRGGKIEMRSRVAISTQQILRDIYMPGATGVCLAIRAAPERVFDFTYIGRAVAIVTDGSAVAGPGNVGLRADLPALEGKAAVLATVADISGIPLLVESASVDHFVEVVHAVAPSFGAILLTDISSPRCFEIEQKLRARLGIPVLHCEQHAAAAVTLAALQNATRQTGKVLSDLTVGVVGLGAAGLAIARLLHAHGVKQLLGNDVRTEAMGRLAQLRGQRETLERLMSRSDVVICATGTPRLIPAERVRKDQIIFALSTPESEIDPAAALAAGAAVAADARSIIDVLCFPGLFDAALRTRVRGFTDAMLVAAAGAIASAARPGQLLPDPLEPGVHARVSQAVQAVIEPASATQT